MGDLTLMCSGGVQGALAGRQAPSAVQNLVQHAVLRVRTGWRRIRYCPTVPKATTSQVLLHWHLEVFQVLSLLVCVVTGQSSVLLWFHATKLLLGHRCLPCVGPA